MSRRIYQEDLPRLRGPYIRNRLGLYQKARKSHKRRGRAWLWGLGLILALAIIIPSCNSYYSTKEHIVTVDYKERVCSLTPDGNNECKYLVFTDGGTFEVTDSIFLLRWNSSDVYGRIKPGQTYRIESYGWRFGCTSSYQNIKSIEPV